MSDMSQRETIERFDEGLAKAASVARELATTELNAYWLSAASQFEAMRVLGLNMANNKSRSRMEIEKDIAIQQRRMAI